MSGLFQLAVVAYVALRRLVETLRGAPDAESAREEAAVGLRAFGAAQRTAEPSEHPDLPGWGEDCEPAPERVADRILAGEGTVDEVAAYAAGLDVWIHYGLPLEKRVVLLDVFTWDWTGTWTGTPIYDLRRLQALAPFQPAHFRMSAKTANTFLDHHDTLRFIQNMGGDVAPLERQASRFRIAGLGDIEVGEVPDGTVLFVSDSLDDDGNVLGGLFGVLREDEARS